MTLQDKFIEFYRDLGPQSVAKLPDVYHEKVIFVDPVGEHHGLEAVKHYFQHLLSATESCHFEVTQMFSDEHKALARWQMKMRHPRIGKGKEITLEGVSELTFASNRIIKQVDFYDLGTMIYEHIPVLGSIIRFVKKKMKNQ